jgi:uncharacterized lipoprotein YmbA
MMTRVTLLFAGLLGLAACGTAPDRYAVTPPPVTERQRIAFSSLEVRDVSLPAYAAADEITLLGADGRLQSDGGVLWADTPSRSVALELSRNLAQLTGARIASEPWPFDALPDARLDVRFETLLAGADGAYRAIGQYFVATDVAGRERSGFFDLSVAFDPDAGPQAIAVARGQVILDLARFIARNGLR